MARLANEFTWSITRDKRLRACARQYWFQHYGMWHGWEDGAPQRTREAYVLSKLKGRAAWVGIRVHECIARSLQNLRRGQEVLPTEKILEIVRGEMRTDFANSRRRHYRAVPKQYVGLFEHEYDLPVTDEEWKRSADLANECLRNFYASETYARLRALPREAFVEVEEKMTHFTFEGVKVWASLDCAVREADTTVIYDWKTGDAGENHSVQLTCYALYGSQAWSLPPEKMRLVEYNLRGGQPREYGITPKEIESVQAYIRGSIADMRALLADPARNVPRPEEAFATTDDDRTCRRCNYLKICPRGEKVLPPMRAEGTPGVV